jgi:hypothetical protein
MHRTPFPARAIVALLVVLLLPAAMVRAQTPPASPAAGELCTAAREDPTAGNDITFARLAGPPKGATEGPSLYQVTFNKESAIFRGGCGFDPLAVSVTKGPLFLKAFQGNTDVFFRGGIPEGLECKLVTDPPDTESPKGCTLVENGPAVTLNDGDEVFHEDDATYEYAASDKAFGLNNQPSLANAMAAGALSGRVGATTRIQPASDQSMTFASTLAVPLGCGTECHPPPG